VIQLSRFSNSNASQLKIDSSSNPGIDSFKQMGPILEGIVQGIEDKSAEQIISEFYIGATGLWGSMEFWPKSIEKFYGQLNYKVNNPESFACVESKDRMIIQSIKNKWLSTTGVSFKGRFERLKQVGEKNIRQDGTKIGTRVVVVGELSTTIKCMEGKDFRIKGIEEHGPAMKYKIIQKGKNKGKKQFVEVVK
jgi:hypothetical protein